MVGRFSNVDDMVADAEAWANGSVRPFGSVWNHLTGEMETAEEVHSWVRDVLHGGSCLDDGEDV